MFNITNEKEVQSVGMVSPNTLVHGDLYLKAGYSVTGVTKGFTCKRMSSENDGNKDGGVRVWNKNKDQLEPKLVFIKLV